MGQIAQFGTAALLPNALLFVAVLLMVAGVAGALGRKTLVVRRLSATAGGLATAVGASAQNAPPVGSLFLRDESLKRFGHLVTPKTEEELAAARKRLARAGYRDPQAVRLFYASRAIAGLAGAAIAALLVPLFATTLPLPILILIVLVMTIIGFLAPSFWIERRIQYRVEAARLGFPDVLDMLLVCIEGGHGTDQALMRVARETSRSNPVLSQELEQVATELRLGKERRRVLRAFADRLGIDDITSFVSVLLQSEEYGVSIGDALRVYAADMRNKRIMRAEEKANKMPVKLALATILFTVPPIILMLAGPSVLMILRAFASMANGTPPEGFDQ